MSYRKIIVFGDTNVNAAPVYDNDPLTYCIGNNASQRFNHGTNADLYGQNSNPCQVFLSQRCAKKWDDVCEYASCHVANNEYATRADTMGAGSKDVIGLTPGDILLRNTAQEKYRIGMHGCELKTEPFNPVNPSSPCISYYVGRDCVPEYAVDPATIDSDIVMNKILDNPRIAIQLLTNIKNTMRRKGTLGSLVGTRLGKFYGLCPTVEKFTLTAPTNIFQTNSAVDSTFPQTTYPTSDGLPTSPYIIPTVSGLVPSEYLDWWPTQYIDFWPTEYDGAWQGAYKRAQRGP